MSSRGVARALAGAWLEHAEATCAVQVRGGVVPSTARQVESVVVQSLKPFVLGPGESELTELVTVKVCADSDGVPTATSLIDVVLIVDGAAAPSGPSLHEVVVRCEQAGFGLDDVIGRSMGAAIARGFGAESEEFPEPDVEPSAGWSARDIVDRILDVARSSPNRRAISGNYGAVGYGDLVHRAQRRAEALDASGAPAVVTVLYDRSADAVIEMLGALLSGRAYALLAPSDSAAYNADLARWVSATSTEVGALAAYVSLTSGTTGRPKAIVVERAQLSAYCMFLETAGICGPEVTMPALSAPGFDAIVKQIWGQLGAGGEVWLPRTDDLILEIENSLRIEGVAINTVPTVWRQVLETVAEVDFPQSGTLLLGGEALEPELVARTHELWPGAVVVNLYGPSECTSNATWFRGCEATRDVVPIGEAVVGSRTAVLGDDLASVPIGAIGELHVAGDCVSRGYLGDPRSTAAAYLPDAGDTTGRGGRMYATGDLVRRTAAGLVHLGRVDSQQKVNGVRVDVETLRRDLLSIDGVDEAAVTAGNGSLDVFVAPEVVANEVTAYAKRHWRSEIGGAQVHGVAALPRTASGKLDAAALRRTLSDTAPGAAAEHDTDAPESHRVMRVIWSNVLGDTLPLTRASVLVDLGGNSMKRLKLVALYRRILRVEVSLDDFAERHTLGDHEDFLIDRVDRDHLDELARTLEPVR